MKNSTLLFDLDGTLVDTISLYEIACLQILREYGAEVPLEKFQGWYMSGLHTKQIAELCGLSEDIVPELRKRRDDLYMQMLATETTWLPGAEDVLKAAKKKGPVGIVTGSWKSYLDAMRPRTNIYPYAGAIVTADDMHDFMKPHPHGLLLCADRLGVDPTTCVYIGDQAFDIEAANAAGMVSVLFRGKHTPENAEKGATHVCDTLEGIREFFP
ncbi:MAG: HAD family phosphatase [Candidatus Peregrinibacteria bacterium]|nr:HAD family phosphatase [Candidatus Peregrinibacteria bacterium]